MHLIFFIITLPFLSSSFIILTNSSCYKVEKQRLDDFLDKEQVQLFNIHKKDVKPIWGDIFYDAYLSFILKREIFMGISSYKNFHELNYGSEDKSYDLILDTIKNIYPHIIGGDFKSDLRNQEIKIKNINLKESSRKRIVLDYFIDKLSFYKKENKADYDKSNSYHYLRYVIEEINDLFSFSIPYMSKEESKFKSVKTLYEEEKYGKEMPPDKNWKSPLNTKDRNIIKNELTEIEKSNDILKNEIALLENDFKKLEILLEKIKVFDSDFIENANAYIEHIDSLLSEVQNV